MFGVNKKFTKRVDKERLMFYIKNTHNVNTKGGGSMNPKEIGKTLRVLRCNESVAKVADSIGISQSALRMYEAGERIPRDEIKIRIAEYYGMSVGDIFFNEKVHKT